MSDMEKSVDREDALVAELAPDEPSQELLHEIMSIWEMFSVDMEDGWITQGSSDDPILRPLDATSREALALEVLGWMRENLPRYEALRRALDDVQHQLMAVQTSSEYDLGHTHGSMLAKQFKDERDVARHERDEIAKAFVDVYERCGLDGISDEMSNRQLDVSGDHWELFERLRAR